jgi:trigger factor
MADIVIKKTSEEHGAAMIAVTVPPEHVKQAEDRATTDYQKRARHPGFRRGKAPVAIVKKQFADDIRQQVLGDLVRESWTAALAQEALQPIADPHIHNLKWEAGAPVTFEFHVELKPDVKLERLGGFRVKRSVATISDEQVTTQSTRCANSGPWPVEAPRRPSRDMVRSITVATRVGDTVKEPQAHQLVLGEGRAVPDVEERIMTLTPGQSIDTTVRFPDDFADEAKRGQSRDVRITLHEVKRQQLPELDDAFAREVGDFDSLDALRRAVREDLEKEAAREADARVRAELIEQVVAANGVVAPRSLVDRVLGLYAQAYGIPEDRLDGFATEFRPVAEAQVRRDLVLDHIVEREKLRVTETELDERIQELAKRRNMPAAELYASLEKAKRLRDIERGLTEEKVFAYLLSQSTVE